MEHFTLDSHRTGSFLYRPPSPTVSAMPFRCLLVVSVGRILTMPLYGHCVVPIQRELPHGLCSSPGDIHTLQRHGVVRSCMPCALHVHPGRRRCRRRVSMSAQQVWLRCVWDGVVTSHYVGLGYLKLCWAE